jgi:hypothetical protein
MPPDRSTNPAPCPERGRRVSTGHCTPPPRQDEQSFGFSYGKVPGGHFQDVQQVAATSSATLPGDLVGI